MRWWAGRESNYRHKEIALYVGVYLGGLRCLRFVRSSFGRAKTFSNQQNLYSAKSLLCKGILRRGAKARHSQNGDRRPCGEVEGLNLRLSDVRPSFAEVPKPLKKRVLWTKKNRQRLSVFLEVVDQRKFNTEKSPGPNGVSWDPMSTPKTAQSEVRAQSYKDS